MASRGDGRYAGDAIGGICHRPGSRRAAVHNDGQVIGVVPHDLEDVVIQIIHIASVRHRILRFYDHSLESCNYARLWWRTDGSWAAMPIPVIFLSLIDQIRITIQHVATRHVRFISPLIDIMLVEQLGDFIRRFSRYKHLNLRGHRFICFRWPV